MKVEVHEIPRVLVVARRHVRKHKYVDFVGELHLELLVRYGAVPLIVPRVEGMSDRLDEIGEFHGLLLVEGEDIDPSLYGEDGVDVDGETKMRVMESHSSDVMLDREKDMVELVLVRKCLALGIPLLGICRGSQMINVACGGELAESLRAPNV